VLADHFAKENIKITLTTVTTVILVEQQWTSIRWLSPMHRQPCNI